MPKNFVNKVDWKRFCQSVPNARCNETTTKKLNRFHARYQIASRFESISAAHYSEKALRGYASGIKLILAFSAAERLGEALGQTVYTWNINDRPLADRLRTMLPSSREVADAHFDRPQMSAKVVAFTQSEDPNVTIAARALRIMMAHGSFTPTGIDALTAKGANTLLKLSNLLLDECANRFNGWLNLHSVRP